MTNTNVNISPRERILATAKKLFFYQGYRATGINEVIAKSGVAKATFYNHFPTKEDLCLAYLQEVNTSEYDSITNYINKHKTPRARFLAVIEAIEPWLKANSMRGCSFLNMVAEIPDPESRLRRLGTQHYNMVQDLIQTLSQELIESDETRYGDLKAQELANEYMVILVGAIAMTEVYNDLWPVRQAVAMVKRLIE